MRAMNRKTAALVAALSLFSGLASLVAQPREPLKLVPALDLERYLGRWYEVARFQQSFERNLVGVTAEYSLRPDGRVSVLNSGFKKSLDGPLSSAKGVAWVPDPSRPAALKVSFFWPFAGDYLVFGLDTEGYQWALVGDNSRKYLWFLSRSPEVSSELMAKMRDLAAGQGYDLSKLYEVPQRPR